MVKDLEIISAGKLLHVKAGGESGNEACVTLARAVDEQVREHGSVCVLLETRRLLPPVRHGLVANRPR